MRRYFMVRCLAVALAMVLGATCVAGWQAKAPDLTTYYAIKQLLRERVRFIVQDERATFRPTKL